MVTKNGGYAIVKHNDSDIFAKVKNAFENEKPILFYDDDKTCFYVDSVKLNGDGDYEFTKGGKTWTVTDNNTLSSEGQIQNIYKDYVIGIHLIDVDTTSRTIYFRYTTTKDLTIYNNVTPTVEILNEIVNSYDAIIFYDTEGYKTGSFENGEFDVDGDIATIYDGAEDEWTLDSNYKMSVTIG